jgi:hypothetical protein
VGLPAKFVENRRACPRSGHVRHAYQMDFGVNATAYIDTFFRNIN